MTQLLIKGHWVDGESIQVLKDKYSEKEYGQMAVASVPQVTEAVDGALQGFESSHLSPYDRYQILMQASRLTKDHIGILSELMKNEAGFTLPDAENEVRRCVQTLELSAESAKHLNGELIPMEVASGMKNRIGYTLRMPRGVICAITPFNSPLNTVAHKLGPALAGGNAVVLKPSEITPLTSVELFKILIEAGLPSSLLALVNGPGETIGRQLLLDQRIAYYAFTGSTRVGLEIQKAAGLRGLQLELGSIASTIVCHDADIDMAIPKIINAGFRKAGQVCTSVQKLLVDRRITATFIPKLIAAAKLAKAGDPADPATIIGPMISHDHAMRAMSFVHEAIESGAQLLTGGTCVGNVMEPTILINVKDEMRVYCEEIFAPVISILEFDHIDEAVLRANDSPFGLAVGLFTSNLSTAFKTSRKLRFGGIHINEASSARADVMPFGGVKNSGFGREGPAYATREMTEERLITIAY